MNLSSPATLTFISIILQTLSSLSFCLFYVLSILVNMSTSLYARQKSHFWSSYNLFRHITCSGCFFPPSVSIRPLSCLHHTVYKPSTTPTSNTYSFRWLHSIHVGSFLTDLKSSQLITDSPNPKSLGSLLSAYNTALSALLSSRSVTAKSILTKFRTSAPRQDIEIGWGVSEGWGCENWPLPLT